MVVEDEMALIDSIKMELTYDNYTVITATDGAAAIKTFKNHSATIDLIILDWMLPGIDGLEVLRQIRHESTVPVIMLTARSFVSDKVTGLRCGADDYVTKPFEFEELLARIEGLLRRSQTRNQEQQYYRLSDLELDTKGHVVSRGGKTVALTHREYQLLMELIRHHDEVRSRDELLDAVWGANFDGEPNIIDVYIRMLRKKIRDAESPVQLIHTVRGVGYVLSEDY